MSVHSGRHRIAIVSFVICFHNLDPLPNHFCHNHHHLPFWPLFKISIVRKMSILFVNVRLFIEQTDTTNANDRSISVLLDIVINWSAQSAEPSFAEEIIGVFEDLLHIVVRQVLLSFLCAQRFLYIGLSENKGQNSPGNWLYLS